MNQSANRPCQSDRSGSSRPDYAMYALRSRSCELNPPPGDSAALTHCSRRLSESSYPRPQTPSGDTSGTRFLHRPERSAAHTAEARNGGGGDGNSCRRGPGGFARPPRAAALDNLLPRPGTDGPAFLPESRLSQHCCTGPSHSAARAAETWSGGRGGGGVVVVSPAPPPSIPRARAD